MPKKKTHEEYLEDVKKINPNINVLGKYTKSHIKTSHRCNICGNEWSAFPSNILKGHGCPKCKNKTIRQKLIKTHEEYVNEVEIKNSNIEVIGTYVGNKTKIIHKCKICNYKWLVSPLSILKGHGCPECKSKKMSQERSKTHEEYIEEVRISNPDIKVVGLYKRANIKIKHKCKICNHEWDVIPNSISKGYGCPKCALKKQSVKQTKTHEQYVYEVSIINPDIEVVGKYKNARTKILHRCKKCNNEWDILPDGVLRGNGCVKCKSYRGEEKILKYLCNNGIMHNYQKTFSDLRGIGRGLLSYDFYVKSHNLLIEYQGIQHYEPVDYFGGEEQLKIQQEHDKRKRDYAELHNINLLEIRYDEDVDTLLDKYFNNINNSNNLNSESLETVMPTIAI